MISTRARRRHFTEEERTELLRAYQESGLTQREFAAQNGLSLSWLSIWLRKSRKSDKGGEPGRLVRLPMGLEVGGKPRSTYKIGFSSGQSLEVSTGFDLEEVKRLCQLLREI
jgi:transcriptional regulator with XRE-family HTH domain